MKKVLLILSLFGLLATSSFAVSDSDHGNIALVVDHPEADSMGDRSLNVSPTAFIEGEYIFR